MSEIQRWKQDCAGNMTTEKDGGYVRYLDHLAALEALKKPVPMSMREHAEAIQNELWRLTGIEEFRHYREDILGGIESYLSEHFAEKKQ